jgi:DnaJ homolog subfamily C member 2
VVADGHFGLSEANVESTCASLDIEQLKNFCDGMDGKDAAEKARLLSNALHSESSSKEAEKIEVNGVEHSAPKSNSTGGRAIEGSIIILNS